MIHEILAKPLIGLPLWLLAAAVYGIGTAITRVGQWLYDAADSILNKRTLLLFAVAAGCFAQDVSVLVTPYVLPCGQGSTLLGLLPCGPDSQQGIFVHLRSEDADFASYGVTVRYRTAAGEKKTATKSVAREDGWTVTKESSWTTVAFQIGRVKTPYLPDGVIVDGVDVVKQGAPVSVPIGEAYFAAKTIAKPSTWATSECSGRCYVEAMRWLSNAEAVEAVWGIATPFLQVVDSMPVIIR